MKSRTFGKHRHRYNYEPHTTSKPTKKKKYRQRDFITKNLDTATINHGIENEYAEVKQKNWMFFVGIIFGVIMTFYGIKDDGMELKMLGFKYSGALVGVAVSLLCIFGIIKNKAKVRIG